MADGVTTPTLVIEPARGWVPLKLGEVWAYRELLYFLAWRDVKVRYKQTILGIAWAVLQPLLTMLVFAVIFGRLAGLPSDGAPYPAFVYCALLPWQLFSRALTESANSLVSNQGLITKVYFPRLVVPASAIVAGLVDFAVSFVVFLGLMVFYRITPTPTVVFLPLYLLLAVCAAFGIGLWLSALNVKYRDVRHTLSFLVQIWMFATPIAYSSSLVPAKWRMVYGLNPMTGVVDGFRWALLGTPRAGSMGFVSVVVVIGLLVSGLFYFRRTEKTFADLV